MTTSRRSPATIAVLVRDDRPARLCRWLVRAGLLGVPVRIEDSMNRTAARQSGDGFMTASEARGILRQRARRRQRRLRDDIRLSGILTTKRSSLSRSVARVMVTGGHRLCGCCTQGSNRRAKTNSSCAANRGLHVCLVFGRLVHQDLPIQFRRPWVSGSTPKGATAGPARHRAFPRAPARTHSVRHWMQHGFDRSGSPRSILKSSAICQVQGISDPIPPSVPSLSVT